MTPTPDEDRAVAEAMSLLPTVAPLTPVRRSLESVRVSDLRNAVVATFVGARTCDLAIALTGDEALGDATGATQSISVADLLAPALGAAASVFGPGVLGDAVPGDATVLLQAEGVAVYELLDGARSTGWFAVATRDNRSGGGSGQASVTDSGIEARLGRINDVEMALTVEIGRARMSVRDVLALEPGAVIELDRSAGAPADILLNGRLIAHGEVVVVDQDYAVRVTRILDVQDGLN
jgi:flagellar motor switch protein FliN/FliY